MFVESVEVVLVGQSLTPSSGPCPFLWTHPSSFVFTLITIAINSHNRMRQARLSDVHVLNCSKSLVWISPSLPKVCLPEDGSDTEDEIAEAGCVGTKNNVVSFRLFQRSNKAPSNEWLRNSLSPLSPFLQPDCPPQHEPRI